MPSAFSAALALIPAQELRAARDGHAVEIDQNEAELLSLIRKNVVAYDDTLVDHLLHNCRNKKLHEFAIASHEARLRADILRGEIQAMYREAGVSGRLSFDDKTDHYIRLERIYRSKPTTFIKTALEKYPAIEPVLRFNSHHPRHPITSESVSSHYASGRAGFLDRLGLTPYKEARCVIDAVAAQTPDWLSQLRAVEKSQRIYAKMRKGLELLTKRKDDVLVPYHECLRKTLQYQKEMASTSPAAVVKIVQKTILEEIGNPGDFETITKNWSEQDTRHAKRLVRSIAYNRAQMG